MVNNIIVLQMILKGLPFLNKWGKHIHSGDSIKMFSLEVKWQTSSSKVKILLIFSFFTSTARSMATISFSLKDLAFQNHATKYWLYSGISPLSDIILVNNSISTTPKLKTSIFVVFLPITGENQQTLVISKNTIFFQQNIQCSLTKWGMKG